MEQLAYRLITGYIIFMSILGFILMGIDKRRAINKAWRISEKTLLMIAFLGGGIGSFLGMYAFRHKTRHRAFIILLPLTAVLDITIMLKIYKIL
jgi:uncharacterized membrane protein YsdA (DUF1294 family)